MSTPPPLPSLDQPAAADLARQRLARKSRFPFFSSLPNLKAHSSRKPKPKQEDVAADEQPYFSVSAIRLDNISIKVSDNDHFQDKYQWAVIYENQRGITLFSIPYYSSNSLLPTDPSPFTIPSSTSLKRSHQPDVSLKKYPLPDGNWRWVSKYWMIDMRSDSGEVQHDGFEYNWMFRQHDWRAQVGPLSAGGWVRRRRWIRLMMRPGEKRQLVDEGDDSMPDAISPLSASHSFRNSWNGWGTSNRFSLASLSVATSTTGFREDLYVPELWQGNVDEDWNLCRHLMRMAGSDGAKLELWKGWLGLGGEVQAEPKTAGKQKAVHMGEAVDDQTPGEAASAPPLEYVMAVLRAWLPVILGESLMFPESRRQLVQLLTQADVLSQLKVSSSMTSTLEFWSLKSEVDLRS